VPDRGNAGLPVQSQSPQLAGTPSARDIPEDPGVPESELPQDPFGEFYLMLELEHLWPEISVWTDTSLRTSGAPQRPDIEPG
jgi:hypothetical protein